MNLNKFWEIMDDTGDWHAGAYGGYKELDMT